MSALLLFDIPTVNVFMHEIIKGLCPQKKAHLDKFPPNIKSVQNGSADLKLFSDVKS